MNLGKLIQDTWELGYSIRRFPGGERVIVHRWPAKRMRRVRPLKDLIIANVTRHNPLFEKLQRSQR